MRRFVYLASAILFISISSISLAQTQGEETEEHPGHFCGEFDARQSLWDNHPEYHREILDAKEELQQFTSDFIEAGGPGLRNNYVISVVFHVIHNNGVENISDAQIFDAIRVLNEDFNALNNSLNNLVPAFQGIAGNAGINFELARRDPQGNCTNGIVRVESLETYEGGNNLKQISPIWNRARYLNIWVCGSIPGGVAGFAYRPENVNGGFGLVNDGIVIEHNFLSAIGTSTLGRSHTLTHEVGHWINLLHTWGPVNSPGLAGNCNEDDGIADTPNTTGTQGCNLTSSSCGSLDNVQNFLDYSFCYANFTQGQVNVMLAALNSPVAQRNNLWQPATLALTGVSLDEEVCLADFRASKRTICPGETVAFEDMSYWGITSWDWVVTGPESFESDEANPEFTFNESGEYSVSLTASDGTNNLTATKTAYITVIPNVGEELPYFEGFEGLASLTDGDWYLQTAHQPSWQLANQGATGSKSMYIITNGMAPGQIRIVSSYPINLADADEPVGLMFKVAYAKRQDNNTDRLRVRASTYCGGPRLLLKTFFVNELITAPNQNWSFTPNQQQWAELVIPEIGSQFYTENFQLHFEFVAGGGNNIYVDDINLGPSPSLSVDGSAVVSDLELFPNPAQQEAYLYFHNERSGSAQVILRDIAGRTVGVVYSGFMTTGSKSLIIQRGNLSKGMYFLDIQINDLRVTEKLMFN